MSFLLKKRAGGFLVAAGVWLLLAGLAACGEKKDQEKPPANGTAEKKAAKTPDPFVVPDGKPADLIGYIERLSHAAPEQ